MKIDKSEGITIFKKGAMVVENKPLYTCDNFYGMDIETRMKAKLNFRNLMFNDNIQTKPMNHGQTK